jgi:hypothetical protein
LNCTAPYSLNNFSTVVQQTANLIVVSGVNGDDEYGLEQYGSEYRYSADEQMFVVYVKCSGSGYGFVNGMNTILVPRSVALSSSMNQTFSDLYHLAGGTVFAGRDIEVLSRSSGDVSGSVAMVLAATLSPSDALKLLNAVTHDSSDVLVGESTRIYGNAIYRLHLPLDVLKSIGVIELVSSPAGTPAQGFGEAFYDAIVHVVVGALNFLASVIDFFVDLGLAVLAALSSITQAVSNAVAAAIDAVIAAFAAFVQWAIDYVNDLVNTMLGPIVSVIQEWGEKEWGKFAAASTRAGAEYQSSGEVSAGTQSDLCDIFTGDLFIALLATAIVAEVIFAAVKVISFGIAFILDYASTMIIQVIITYAIGTAIISTTQPPSESLEKDPFLGWLYSLVTQSPKPRSEIDIGFGAFRSCWATFALIPALAIALGNPGKVALSIITVILGYYCLVVGDPVIGVLLVAASGLALANLIFDPLGTVHFIGGELRLLAITVNLISLGMGLRSLHII